MAMPRLVVFDLAGTTMVDDGTVAAVFREVLGERATDEQVARVRGASKREAFRSLAGDAAEGERLFRSFIGILEKRFALAPPRETPGASGVFAWLKGQDVRLALSTGFERETVEKLLPVLGWEPSLFDTVVCGDEVPEGRPSPALLREAMRRCGVADPSAVMAVGDTVNDLEAGTAAGARWVVGVTSGAHDHARLLRAPHTHLVASLVGLREVLR